jgi:predicted enzyme related to lactoylglutathione lyase
MTDPNEIGRITWRDLTVDDAESVAAFYRDVVGWTSDAQDMGGYDDFNMLGGDGECVAGICHARGANAGMPAQWLVYITVADADASAARCAALGGEVLDGPRDMGKMRFCVIRDPAGAVAALVST